jgi:hypothetical protein
MKNDGSSFTDHDVHRFYGRMESTNTEGEWFKCTVE